MNVSERSRRMAGVSDGGRAVGSAVARLDATAARVLAIAECPRWRVLDEPWLAIRATAVGLGALEGALDRMTAAAGGGGAPIRPAVARLPEPVGPRHLRPAVGRQPEQPRVSVRHAGSSRATSSPASGAGPRQASDGVARPAEHSPSLLHETTSPGAHQSPVPDRSAEPFPRSMSDLQRPLRVRPVSAPATPTTFDARAGSSPSEVAALPPNRDGATFAESSTTPATAPDAGHATTHGHETTRATGAAPAPPPGGLAELVALWQRTEPPAVAAMESSAVGAVAAPPRSAAVSATGPQWSFAETLASPEPLPVAEASVIDQLAGVLDELLHREAEQHGLDGGW